MHTEDKARETGRHRHSTSWKAYENIYDLHTYKRAAVLCQLRTGKCRLNSYLAKIGATNSDRCTCRGRQPETVRHFVFECPLWKEERKTLQEVAGNRWGDLSFFLGGRSEQRLPSDIPQETPTISPVWTRSRLAGNKKADDREIALGGAVQVGTSMKRALSDSDPATCEAAHKRRRRSSPATCPAPTTAKWADVMGWLRVVPLGANAEEAGPIPQDEKDPDAKAIRQPHEETDRVSQHLSQRGRRRPNSFSSSTGVIINPPFDRQPAQFEPLDIDTLSYTSAYTSHSDPGSLSTPKPDISTDPHEQTIGLHFPFLIFEAKGNAGLFGAQNQAAVGAACMLRILHLVYCHDLVVWSVTTEGPIHELWVHHRDTEGKYQSVYVGVWRMTNPEGAKAFVGAMARLMLWGSTVYTQKILQALGAVHFRDEEIPNIAAAARDWCMPVSRLRARVKGSRHDRPGSNLRLSPLKGAAQYILDRAHPDGSAPLLSKDWTTRWLHRNPECRRMKQKSQEINRTAIATFEAYSHRFTELKKVMYTYGITASDTYKMDETGFRIGVGGSQWIVTMEVNRPQVSASDTSRDYITSIKAISSDGDVFDPMLSVQGVNHLHQWYTNTVLP
ncbi:transposase [Paraphaeosphaeria sporulosa]